MLESEMVESEQAHQEKAVNHKWKQMFDVINT